MIDKKDKLGEMFENANLPTIRLYKTWYTGGVGLSLELAAILTPDRFPIHVKLLENIEARVKSTFTFDNLFPD